MNARLALGYVPLLDAAPLMVAQSLGFAAEEGLDLTLSAAPSWATLRDMLDAGQVDAAQMLAPLPIATALGLGAAVPMDALMVLNLNGNTIGASRALAARLPDPFDASMGQSILDLRPLRIGVPFVFSMHRELIQCWLGPDPEIITIPPPRMAEALAAGEIDAFCVGEPWGSVAAERGVGRLLAPGSAIWAAAPEKVLAARAGWAEAEPDLAGRLMRSVWRAGRWLGQPQNHAVAADLLARELSVSPEMIERVLAGRLVIGDREARVPGLIEFHHGAANFPWRSQAAWIGAQLARRHGLGAEAVDAARKVFRSDLYRLHLAGTGAVLPGASDKLEGAIREPTAAPAAEGRLILAPDRFWDARIFDPADPFR